ncbi:hypothetical protein DID88_006726 [Monilinia fructigena]|uniref:Uncharacterized protein n=1 Tax=Monilinia fructigena TaxID=38457 RepID=A0A395IG19_9HELO|nr:hypothetical protein DID88_006726 [Monilinia fructigena]
MPAGSDETDHHAAGEITEHVMKNSSSKTDNKASDHPLHNQGEVKGEKVQFRHHEANPERPSLTLRTLHSLNVHSERNVMKGEFMDGLAFGRWKR